MANDKKAKKQKQNQDLRPHLVRQQQQGAVAPEKPVQQAGQSVAQATQKYTK